VSPLTRGILVGAGVAAACLLALWCSLVAGTWLAINTAPRGPVTGSQVVAGVILAVTLVILARAVQLLVADLREPEQHR